MVSPSLQPSGSTPPSLQQPNGSEAMQTDTHATTTSELTSNTQKLFIEVTKQGIVYGDNANAWKKRVSYYFRANIPISYASWSCVDVSFKNTLWEALMKEFYFCVADYKVRRYVEKGFAQKLRTRKVKYRPLLKAAVEESIAACPAQEIDPLHWKGFCINEHTDKAMKIKKINAENRKKWKTTHCLGRRSYAQIIYCMNKQNPGKKARRVDAWKKGRQRANGSILESARETHAQVVEADERIISSGTIDMDDIEHDALSEVFGLDKKCHTRGLSSNVSRKQILHTDFVTSLHDKDVLASNANVDEKIGKMQSKIDSLEGVMKVVLEQVTLTNMTTERANSPNATTPRTEVASSSVPRARIVPSNLMNSYVHVRQSGAPQRVSLLNRKKEVVASGVVDTENGGICHGREVDDGEVKVYVEKVFDGSTPVYDGPQNSCVTLEDIADGGYLVWLKARVCYMDG